MSANQKEYDNVKKELEACQDIVRKSNNTLYVGVTAVLAWAITAKSSMLCLLVYCIIIPIYYIVLDCEIAIMKLGAYLLVFHNDKWEKRVHRLNVEGQIKRHTSAYKYPFIYASIASTILFLCFFDYENICTFKSIQIIICFFLFLWFNVYVSLQKGSKSLRQIYINAWEDVKRKENEAKNHNKT